MPPGKTNSRSLVRIGDHVQRRRKRVYLDLLHCDSCTRHLAFVEGKPYTRLGVRWRPHRVRKVAD